VLVITRQEAVSAVPRLLGVLATTTVRRLPSEVPLDAEDGMPRPCVLNLDTPELIPRGLFVEHITTLGFARMREVCVALQRATGCH
jgi:mRNA interferase MazF